jgi:hypothetical protein
VSQFVTTSQVRAVVGEVRRQQVMDIVRGAVFIGAFLLAWVSLRPFERSLHHADRRRHDRQ